MMFFVSENELTYHDLIDQITSLFGITKQSRSRSTDRFRQENAGNHHKISGRNTAPMFQHFSCRFLQYSFSEIIDLEMVFTHEHNWLERSNSGVVYSTQPYR